MSDKNSAVACAGQPSDEDLLQSFYQKLQLIRDRVASVVHRYHTAAYLVGRPGSSKTYTVKEELGRLDVPWVYQNARMTPMGLFDFIAEHPEHIIVLDDIASLFKNDQAVQILLAALDGKPGEPRVVTYKSADVELKVLFSGAIIAISNIPLRSDPLARALGSRIVVLDHEPSDAEIAAFIRNLALKGFEDLSADECIEVSEFVISETRAFDLRLDLRHLTKAFQDYRQYKHGRSLTSWQDLVRTSLRKLALDPITISSKKDDIAAQRQKVRDAIRSFPNDTPAQIRASGLKQATFYVRRKEVQAEATSTAA
jgi:hypothetical protein